MAMLTVDQIFEQYVKSKPLAEQLRLIALISQQFVTPPTLSSTDLELSPTLLAKIDAGEVHPVMAAFGLWQNEVGFETLTAEIYENRQNQPSRPKIEL